jgi:hypothetical protein
LETIVENLIREADPVEVRRAGTSRRALSIFAALALILGGVALASSADSATPKTKVVTNVDNGKAVVDGAGAVLSRTLGFNAAPAQIDVGALIRSIVCPILTAIATGPLGSLFGLIILPIINSLRAAFGCTSP